MPANQLTFTMPANACNAHLHIIDPAFPNDGKAAAQTGTVETYRALADQLQLPRAVFVQAKPFALDNACLLDAIAKFGPDCARGIAVVDNTVTDEELERLHNGGVRGLRFSVWNPANAVVSFDDCYPLSERIKHLGWNIQLHMGASQLVKWADIIRKLDCKVVIDHMGRMDPALGIKDPAYPFIQEMIDKGNTWVKLSGPYLNTRMGEPWDDASRIAADIAEYAPERVVSELVLLENRKDGPLAFTSPLKQPGDEHRQVGAIVVNCNPFTLGHRTLIEYAASQCEVLHIFVVAENRSDFPADVRYRLVKEGTVDLSNVRVHLSGNYIISSATFPTYFLKKGEDAAAFQSELDITLFSQRIAPELHITKRFAGQEPLDPVTARYNDAMRRILPKYGIEFCEIPRTTQGGAVISASRVRQLLREHGVCDKARALVPASTWRYLKTEFGRIAQ